MSQIYPLRLETNVMKIMIREYHILQYFCCVIKYLYILSYKHSINNRFDF